MKKIIIAICLLFPLVTASFSQQQENRHTVKNKIYKEYKELLQYKEYVIELKSATNEGRMVIYCPREIDSVVILEWYTKDRRLIERMRLKFNNAVIMKRSTYERLKRGNTI
jgi:hypothetical protein